MYKKIALLLIAVFATATACAPAQSQEATLDVNLCWDAPTLNTDGSPLTDLEGFFIYWSDTDGGPYTNSFRVTAKTATCQTLSGFAPGTYYFVATAYNAFNRQSDFSNQTFKDLVPVVIELFPAPPTNLMAE